LNNSIAASPPQIDPDPPVETAKLVFIHASVGEQWLSHWLGEELGANNYFVSDYSVHNHLDFPGHDYCAWPAVLGDPHWMDVLAQHNAVEANYARSVADPGGENTILMIKPCFTQYPIMGNPDDPPCDECDCVPTVAAIKRSLIDLREVLAQHPNRFFVLMTAPPKKQEGMAQGENARALADWMVNEWLAGYEVGNVMVFDLFNVLTSNAEGEGDPCQEWTTYPENPETASDVGLATGNHHRVWNGEVQHQQEIDQSYSAYCHSHPGKGATFKMTQEFVPLLNAHYNAWVAGGGLVAQPAPALAPTQPATPPLVGSATPTAEPSPTPHPTPASAPTVTEEVREEEPEEGVARPGRPACLGAGLLPGLAALLVYAQRRLASRSDVQEPKGHH
jgi:hypothetical protein